MSTDRNEKQASRATPITIRAAQAAACSSLPRELRHFIHVLALYADWRTGRGITGQATLARYMGLGRVQVSRLWARLDALWEAKESPVGALREARHHTSDAYQLVVREGAALRLPELQSRRNDSSATRVIVAPEKVDVASTNVDVPSKEPRCSVEVPKTPPQCSVEGTISSQVLSSQTTPEIKKTSTRPGRPDGLGAGGAAPRSPEVPPQRLSAAELESLFPDEWAKRPDDDGMSLNRRRVGLRKKAEAQRAALHGERRDR